MNPMQSEDRELDKMIAEFVTTHNEALRSSDKELAHRNLREFIKECLTWRDKHALRERIAEWELLEAKSELDEYMVEYIERRKAELQGQLNALEGKDAN